MKTLDQDLKNHTYHACYLIYGTEEYLKQFYKKRFIKELTDGNSVNLNVFEQESLSIDEIIATCDTLPFFSDYRLVIVEDSRYFKSSQEALCKYLEQLPETTVLVFFEKEIDKRNKLYKLVAKKGYVCEMNAQSQDSLIRWIGGYLKRADRKITKQTATLILTTVGEDMTSIAQELEKLIAYTEGRDTIADADVLAICTKRPESRIFDMFDAMAAEDQKRVFQIYYELIENKEPYMRILFMLEKQFNQLLLAKQMSLNNISNPEIASTLKISPWQVGKLLKQSRNFSVKLLKKAMEEAVMNEEAVKNGRLDEKSAVEMILAKYVKAPKS